MDVIAVSMPQARAVNLVLNCMSVDLGERCVASCLAFYIVLLILLCEVHFILDFSWLAPRWLAAVCKGL